MIVVVWSVCVVLAIVALALRYDLTYQPPPADEPADLRPGEHGSGYQQYDRLLTEVRSALRDGRYFARALAPQLREIAHDVAAHRRGRPIPDERLAAALGPSVWQSLDAAPDSRDRDAPPSAADLARILSAIEEL